MGLMDLFRRRAPASSAAATAPAPCVATRGTPRGLLLQFASGAAGVALEDLLEAPADASSEEKLLRAHLSELFIDERCELQADGVVLPWEHLYGLIEDPDYASFLDLLEPPALTQAVPVLDAQGTLSDPAFSVIVTGWRDDAGSVAVERVQAPFVRIGGEDRLVTAQVYRLLQALPALAPASAPRSRRDSELAWGQVRALALHAGALFASQYLLTTIVVTPQTLRLLTRREDSAFGRGYVVEPMFDEAPAGWLEAFDRHTSVQPHYDLSRGGGLTRVILSDPVRQVLEVVKRDMPGRRVAGAQAERFVHNPRAFLGDVAEGVLVDPVDDAPASAGPPDEVVDCVATGFCLRPAVQGGRVLSAVLELTEHYRDGSSRGFRAPIDSVEALARLTNRIGDALADDRLSVPFDEFDLTLDANGQVEFQRMLTVLQMWQAQAQAVIDLDDLYELSDYSERIAGIGPATPIYVPVLQKEKKADDPGWVPDSLTPLLKVLLPQVADPVLVPLTRDWVRAFRQKVADAEQAGDAQVHDGALPTGISTQQARVLADNFQTLLGGQVDDAPGQDTGHGPGAGPGTGPTPPKPPRGRRPPKDTLLVKTNLHQVDYVELRKQRLTPPESAQAELPATLKASIELKAHQRAGVAWFQHLWAIAPGDIRGCLLADDMGLGKTIQLLCFLGRLYEQQPEAPPSLILVPKSLLQNWANEVEKFFTPSYPQPLVLYGAELTARKHPRELIGQALRERGIADLLKPDWVGNHKLVITTYDVLTGHEFSFAKQDFSVVICDEAQRIKNPAAQVTLAVKKLKAKFRVACTGTPVENSLADLWCLFDFVQPGLLGGLESFFRAYRRPIECQTEAQRDALGQLQALIRPQTLRRTKQSIAHDLPKKFFAVSGAAPEQRLLREAVAREELLQVEITDFQRVLYKTGLKRLQDARQERDGKRRGRLSFEALHFMKAVCAEPYCLPGRKFLPDAAGPATHLANSPKLAWLLQELEGIRTKDEKAIVFTEIREVQAALHYFLGERFGLKPFIVNGEKDNRQTYIDKFSAKPGFNVIILSPLAAGAGLNVVAANHVFHFTRAWNPAKEAQATDRAFRIGQTRDVIVYCPTIVDRVDGQYATFEQRLDQLLKDKQALASTTIDGDDLTQMLNGSTGDVGLADFVAGTEGGRVATEVAPRALTLDDVDRLDGASFEVLCALLLSKRGFITEITAKTGGDGGIDVIAQQDDAGLLVQCKSSSQPALGWDAIKEVTAGAARYLAKLPGTKFQRVAITNRHFNATAREQALLNHVTLYERDWIAEQLGLTPVVDVELEELLVEPVTRLAVIHASGEAL